MKRSFEHSIANASSNNILQSSVEREVPLNTHQNGRFTVTVYASSSTIVAKPYVQAAIDLGRAIAARGWVQVNGGGKGLMGHCTEGAIGAGGIVDCVNLKRFFANGMPAFAFRNIRTCDSMIDRRAGLYQCANAFVVLPGGLGTLEEFAEVASWRQLEFHQRVVVLLSVDGFYDNLWNFIERGIEEGFIAEGVRKCIKVVGSAEDAVRAIDEYLPEAIHKNAALSGRADWIPTSPSPEVIPHDENKH